MRAKVALPLAVLLITGMDAATAVSASAAWADQPPGAIADVVAKVQASVVRIIVVDQPKSAPATNQQLAKASDNKPMTSFGSGFVIDPSGLVATNRHVVDKSVSIFVGTPNGARFRAEIVGMPEKADIALLRIHPDKPMTAVGFGDSDKLRVGDTVIAIGSPFGFDNSVTAGIVSSTNRDIMESPFDDYIQTDAAINHGNSGGPLFDLQGKVVGMNSVLFAPANESGSVGLGFAIPSNELQFVFERLEKYGEVRAGMLALRTQQVTGMMAQAIGAPSAGGALVIGLEPEADVMGGTIHPGDIVRTFNGQPVLDPRDLARKAAQAAVGSRATLGLCRAGQTMDVTVPILPIKESPPSSGEKPPGPTSVGLTFAKANGSGAGVTIGGIDPSGSAADSGLQNGDTILRVQEDAVSTPEEAAKALKARSDAKQPYAALLVERGGSQSWIPIALPE